MIQDGSTQGQLSGSSVTQDTWGGAYVKQRRVSVRQDMTFQANFKYIYILNG